MEFVYMDSPNHGGSLVDYRYIVLHHTSSWDDGANTAAYLCNPDAGVSANFVVGTTGIVYSLVPMGTTAWHAGRGTGFGVPDNMMNYYSIGIEIANPGDGYTEYPEAQLKALDDLIAYIDAKMGVANIIDHKMWAPGRKDDMSANFPLDGYITNRKHMTYEPIEIPPKDLVGVHLHEANNTEAQLWYLDEDGEYVKIRSAIRNMVLDVADGSSEPKTPVRVYANDNGTSAQRFKLIPHTYEYGTYYTIESALKEGMVLDVVNGNIKSGAGIQLYKSNDTPAQQFLIVPFPNTEGYMILSRKSGLPLDVDNAGE